MQISSSHAVLRLFIFLCVYQYCSLYRFVTCVDCGRKLHQICVQYNVDIWPDDFVCDNCLKEKDAKRKENKFTAKRMHRLLHISLIEHRLLLYSALFLVFGCDQ
jgi:hypothetical protein